MSELQVEAEGTTLAEVDTVWALVADANTYAQWGPWNGGGYDPPAVGPSYPGCVQWFRFGRRTTSVEKLLEVDPPKRIVYTVERGIRVKNYRAEITLTPNVPSGTSIRWAATWESTLMGRLVHRKLQTVYLQIMDALIAATDRQYAILKSEQPDIEAKPERS
ncbi:MAG: SRPBCC family protein [Acidimicrobiales bacterium]